MSGNQRPSRWERTKYHVIGGGFVLVYFGTMLTIAMIGLAALNGPLGTARYVFLGLVLLLLVLSIVGLPLFFMWDARWTEKAGGTGSPPPARRSPPGHRELAPRFLLSCALLILLVGWQPELWWLVPVLLGLWALVFGWEFFKSRRQGSAAQ